MKIAYTQYRHYYILVVHRPPSKTILVVPPWWVGNDLIKNQDGHLNPPPLRKLLVTPLVGLVGVDLANTQDRHPCHKIGRIAGIK